MPLQLLPASAAAFAPRSAPTIVLDHHQRRVEPWLTQTLKRINRVKRPLNSVAQHFRCLTETLGAPSAIWTLASLMLPKAPEDELKKDDDPLLMAISNYQLVSIEAYVVHVDMVSQHEVAFKLTPETIETLIDYHKSIYCVDVAASTYAWPEKDAQIRKMQDDFVQAVNRFVFRTAVRALEGLEEEGAGELLEGRSAEAKTAIMNLFLPLLAPPPRIVDVVYPGPPLSTSMLPPGVWWQPTHTINHLPGPVDTWRILPSTPSPSSTPGSESQSSGLWTTMDLDAMQLPSPTPSYSRPVFGSSLPFYSSPEVITAMPTIPFPSALPCGTSMLGFGVDGFSYTGNVFAPQYATI
ncbi:hypothetical protein AAFC00_004704 [Neodothiora populina]|uniref:C6 transcription factor n=1 Tax=Neodothiora populina TaxID=2781224 RepID=A0ABR3P3Q1_9PEZI